jgi:hypothetical protein
LDFCVTTGSWPREQQPTGRHWLAALKRNAVVILGTRRAKHLMEAGLRPAGRHRPRPSSAYDLNRHLPKGPTELKFNFIKTGDFAGTGELYVNGEKVDEAEMPRMHISTYSLAETCDHSNIFKHQANL